MKKYISRLSYYACFANMISRLIWRALKVSSILYAKALRETKFDFMLVNSVFFSQAARGMTVDGNVAPQYEPLLTESLLTSLYFQGLIAERPAVKCPYLQALVSITEKDVCQSGSLVEYAFNDFLCNSDKNILWGKDLTPNEAACALSFQIHIPSTTLYRKDVIQKIIDCKLSPGILINPSLMPDLANSLIARNKNPCEWAELESINKYWLEKIIKNGQFPAFCNISKDTEALAVWAETHESKHESAGINSITAAAEIINACTKHKKKISFNLVRRYRSFFDDAGLDGEIIAEAEIEPIDLPCIFPENWEREKACPDLKVLNTMLESQSETLRSQAIKIIANHRVSTTHLTNLTDNLDLLKIKFKENLWHLSFDITSPYYKALPSLINDCPNLVSKATRHNLPLRTVLTCMSEMGDKLIIPKKYKSNSIAKSMKHAVLRNCPFRAHQLINLDEAELLSHATCGADYEFIFNYCKNKSVHNLGSYPSYLIDNHLSADLGL